MQLLASTSARVGLFALLALGSLSLKAAAGPGRDRLIASNPARFERAAESILAAQQFATELQTYKYRTNLVVAEHGGCRVAVRDATITSLAPAFAKDVDAIGPIRYFYGGRSYDQPPDMKLRLGRLEVEVLGRLGMARPIPILVAFAASPGCGPSDFGLANIRLQA